MSIRLWNDLDKNKKSMFLKLFITCNKITFSYAPHFLTKFLKIMFIIIRNSSGTFNPQQI